LNDVKSEQAAVEKQKVATNLSQEVETMMQSGVFEKEEEVLEYL